MELTALLTYIIDRQVTSSSSEVIGMSLKACPSPCALREDVMMFKRYRWVHVVGAVCFLWNSTAHSLVLENGLVDGEVSLTGKSDRVFVRMDCRRRTAGCFTFTLVLTAGPIAGDADLAGLGIPASDTLSKNLEPLAAVWAFHLFRLVSGGRWWWWFHGRGVRPWVLLASK